MMQIKTSYYDRVALTPNPNYPNLFEYKYNKPRSLNSAFGINCALKAEIPALDFLGCNFVLFCNINQVQILSGLDICISLGKVRQMTRHVFCFSVFTQSIRAVKF